MAETLSSCPRCGAANTSGAWMCWRCNSTLVSRPVPEPALIPAVHAAPRSPHPPTASPQSSPPESNKALPAEAQFDLSLLSTPRRGTRNRQPILWALSIGSLALLIVAPVVMKGILPKDSSPLPDSIEGYTRVDNDSNVDRARNELGKAALSGGESVTAAVYRKPGKGLVVEVYSGVSPELTASYLLGTLAQNLQPEGTTIDISKETPTYGENGVTQACAPMSGDLAGSVCYWADLQRVGLIMGVNVDVRETGSLAEAVRHAVDG